MTPKSRWLTVDPGEDTGLSVWQGTELIMGATVKMWPTADLVGTILGLYAGEIDEEWSHVYETFQGFEVERIVCEDWRLYPWKLKEMSWDQCRTARLIGGITQSCRWTYTPLVLQGASIKERAVDGGAEQMFYRPLHENRHQNDAIMHGWYYVQTQLRS